jgi:hypothetical protein
VGRLWELAALYLALIAAGAIIATPTWPADQRVAALAGILAAAVYMSRRSRRGPG